MFNRLTNRPTSISSSELHKIKREPTHHSICQRWVVLTWTIDSRAIYVTAKLVPLTRRFTPGMLEAQAISSPQRKVPMTFRCIILNCDHLFVGEARHRRISTWCQCRRLVEYIGGRITHRRCLLLPA